MMAEPLCVIEHFVRLFLGQWHCGLQPNLDLRTDSSGAISVNFNVKSLPHAVNIEEVQQHKHRRSGRGSRSRRQNQPSQGIQVHNKSNCSSGQSHDPPTPSTSASSLILSDTSTTSDQLTCDDENATNQASGHEPSQVVLNLDEAKPLDFGLSGEVMEKLNEYLWVDPSPSAQTLSNIACGFKIPFVKIEKYVKWKQSTEKMSTVL